MEKANGVTYSPATEQDSQVIDIPLDWQRDPATGLGGNEPGISKILNNDGTYPGFRIVYLQRLADPTQAWNAHRESLPHDRRHAGRPDHVQRRDARPTTPTTRPMR